MTFNSFPVKYNRHYICAIFTELTWDFSSFIVYILSIIFFFFFNFYLFIYLCMAVSGLRFCARAFSSCGKWGPLFIAVRGPLTIAASLVAEHRLQTRRLSNKHNLKDWKVMWRMCQLKKIFFNILLNILIIKILMPLLLILQNLCCSSYTPNHGESGSQKIGEDENK